MAILFIIREGTVCKNQTKQKNQSARALPCTQNPRICPYLRQNGKENKAPSDYLCWRRIPTRGTLEKRRQQSGCPHAPSPRALVRYQAPGVPSGGCVCVGSAARMLRGPSCTLCACTRGWLRTYFVQQNSSQQQKAKAGLSPVWTVTCAEPRSTPSSMSG